MKALVVFLNKYKSRAISAKGNEGKEQIWSALPSTRLKWVNENAVLVWKTEPRSCWFATTGKNICEIISERNAAPRVLNMNPVLVEIQLVPCSRQVLLSSSSVLANMEPLKLTKECTAPCRSRPCAHRPDCCRVGGHLGSGRYSVFCRWSQHRFGWVGLRRGAARPRRFLFVVKAAVCLPGPDRGVRKENTSTIRWCRPRSDPSPWRCPPFWKPARLHTPQCCRTEP